MKYLFVFVFYGCVTNDHKLCGWEQYACIISRVLWGRDLGLACWVVWKAAVEVLVRAGSSSGGLTGVDPLPNPVRWQGHLCGCRTQVLCFLLAVCQGCSPPQESAMALCHVALSSGLLTTASSFEAIERERLWHETARRAVLYQVI